MVNNMVEYIIPINGLALGSHEYQFKIDDSFFKNFEYLDIDNGLLELKLELVKESTLLNLLFSFEGFVELVCDRCLEKFNLDVEDSFRLIIKYGEEHEEISDEIVTIPSSESSIDISQYIFEYINLMLPISRFHPDDKDGNSTCDEDMIDRLNEYSEQKSDPRWDALKNVKLD